MTLIADPKLGYYSVGTEKYSSKIQALISATKQNVHPTWHFNDAIWANQNWLREPETDLTKLYQLRAKQLREKYDYLSVFFSGGSDSWNMVKSFLDSGCFIDEIITIWNRKYNRNFIADATIIDPKNIEAEFDLTTRHGLDWIKNQSPKTKITYIDISDGVLDNFKKFDGEEWLTVSFEHLNPQFVRRWSVTQENQTRNQLDRGFRTALVYGVDKPKVCIKDNKFQVYFLDKIVNCFTGNWNDKNYSNIETEFFYWSPDCAEIVIKQSHIIKRWFEQNPLLKPLLYWPGSALSRQTYEVITRSLIYPGWNINTFQCAKPNLTSHMEWDAWFFEHFKDTKAYACWNKGIEFVEANIDTRWLNYDINHALSFVGMTNGHFALE